MPPTTAPGQSARSRAGTPLWGKVLAVLAALAVVPGGAFLAIANVGTGGKVAIAAGVVWWLVASALIGRTVLRRRPDLRRPVRTVLAVAAVASIVTAFVASRGNTVDEDIVTGVPATEVQNGSDRDAASRRGAGTGREAASAKRRHGPRRSAAAAPPSGVRNVQILSGTFAGQSGHRGEGNAAVVKLPSGDRVLTFGRFDVDPGAGGLRIYLHAGRTASDDLGDYVELADLKGTKGEQQYGLPADLSLRRYSSVVIWCVPFSTRIAEAPLS